MILPNEFDEFTKNILELYERYTISVLQDIARRLAGMTLTETAAWQMNRLIQSGLVYENALRELSKITKISETELERAFTEAGVKSLKFDDEIYRKAGLNPLPLNLSPQMVQVLKAGIQKTQGIFKNLTLTTANSSQQLFLDAADLVYQQVSLGAFSYQQALREACINLANQGLQVVSYPSGHVDKIDVSLRRAALTGIGQTTAELQLTRMDELDVDLVQTSAHIGSRPQHMLWQGKIFSRSGINNDYPPFVESTGFGSGSGLCGWNCRHSFYPWFPDISKNAYDQATIEDYSNKTIKYKDKEYSFFETTQIQRSIERSIRRTKREIATIEAAGLDATKERANLFSYQAQMRDFIRETKLVRQRSREQVPGT